MKQTTKRQCKTCSKPFECLGCKEYSNLINACECGECIPKSQANKVGVYTPCDLKFRGIEYEGTSKVGEHKQ
jgi:hypothetical protein